MSSPNVKKVQQHSHTEFNNQKGVQGSVDKNRKIEEHQNKSSDNFIRNGQTGNAQVQNTVRREENEIIEKQVETKHTSQLPPSNPNSAEANAMERKLKEADKMAQHQNKQQNLADRVIDDKENTLAGVEADLEEKARILAEKKARAAEEEKRRTAELHNLEAKTMQMAEKLEERQAILRAEEEKRAREVAELENDALRLAQELASKATQERKHTELMIEKMALNESVAKKKADELIQAQREEKKTITIENEQIRKNVELIKEKETKLNAEYAKMKEDMERKKKSFEEVKATADQAVELAKKLSDERHEIELRLQELLKSEEDARKQADFLANQQAKERNAIQAEAQELGDLKTELETTQRELTQKTEEFHRVEVKIDQIGVNEEEAIKKAQELANHQAEERKTAEERLKQLQKDEIEAIRKVNELKANMTHGEVGRTEEPTKVDVFQHSHYDTQEGISASTARVVSGDRTVEVERHVTEENERNKPGVIGSMLKSLF